MGKHKKTIREKGQRPEGEEGKEKEAVSIDRKPAPLP
jgi:hypothetical protein